MVEHRPRPQVGLAHPEGLLDPPQVVVAGDDLAWGHQLGTDVGDVSLQPDQPTGACDVSSRDLVPLVVLTNRGGFAVFSPSTTARALFSWAVRVLLSRPARFVEYAHTARHDPGWCSGSQMGSNLCLGLFSMLRRFFGVIVSMICPSLNASPCQRKWDSKSTGALVTREPTMNRRSASSSSLRLVADSIPASATTTMSAMLCRAWNCLMIGRIVRVSALLPSKQPISSGNPRRSTRSPTTTCGSTRRSLE